MLPMPRSPMMNSPGFIQHSWGEISGDDRRNVGRELERSMSAAGGDIKRPPMRLWLCDGEQSIEIAAFGVRLAGDVAFSELAVTRLRERL